MGIFDNVNSSEGRRGGRYMTPGNYTLEINELKVINSQNPMHKGVEFFVAEMTITDADNEYANGDVVSWMVNSSHASAPDNITSFFMAVLKASADDITQEVCKDACGENQPLRGMALKANAYNIKTKANTDFTAVDWSHVAAAA